MVFWFHLGKEMAWWIGWMGCVLVCNKRGYWLCVMVMFSMVWQGVFFFWKVSRGSASGLPSSCSLGVSKKMLFFIRKLQTLHVILTLMQKAPHHLVHRKFGMTTAFMYAQRYSNPKGIMRNASYWILRALLARTPSNENGSLGIDFAEPSNDFGEDMFWSQNAKSIANSRFTIFATVCGWWIEDWVLLIWSVCVDSERERFWSIFSLHLGKRFDCQTNAKTRSSRCSPPFFTCM